MKRITIVLEKDTPPPPPPPPQPPPPPDEEVDIVIEVKSKDGTWLQNANVYLSGEKDYAGVTDVGGEVYMKVKSGKYKIIVERYAYKKFEGEVTI